MNDYLGYLFCEICFVINKIIPGAESGILQWVAHKSYMAGNYFYNREGIGWKPIELTTDFKPTINGE